MDKHSKSLRALFYSATEEGIFLGEQADIKNDVAEIKGDVKALTKSMGELQVLVAGNYLTRREFIDHEKKDLEYGKENRGDHNKLWGAIITFGIVFVGWLLNLGGK